MDRINGLREELEAGPPADVDRLIERIRRSGALDASLADARVHLNNALSALRVLPSSADRDALEVLGHYLVERAR